VTRKRRDKFLAQTTKDHKYIKTGGMEITFVKG
jgi:hypothetical protein